ncbi:MAG: MBOAT family protein [Ruminococcus sp.]|nr:MBOAT family protein [Ruminococcus sp.]
MTLFDFDYFILIFALVVGYYALGRFQKYVLLTGSILFFIMASAEYVEKSIGIFLFVSAVTYTGAIIISKLKGKKRRFAAAATIFLLVAVLVVFKYLYNLADLTMSIFNAKADISFLSFVSIIGVSYFTLSAIGYIVDVYWNSYKTELNPADVILFIFFFPQLVSGPITRFDVMKKQFNEKTVLKYENISHGMRRMLWGYFKKLVISERMNIVVSAIYNDYTSYSAIGIIGATICYAIRLYTDFSGCMDIIIGTSRLFGIELPENFSAPFFSKNVKEFWQRWHITLGIWFKDYVMYPLQKSELMVRIGKASKKRFGKKHGKRIPFYLSMTVLWFLIGIWHGGTGYYFVASAIIPCFYLIMSDLLQPVFKGINNKLKIDTECFSWRLFQSIRTGLLLCVCWFFVCSGSLSAAADILCNMCKNPVSYTTFASAMKNMGLNAMDILLVITGCLAIALEDYFSYHGENITQMLDKQNISFRFIVEGLEAAAIAFYGMAGTSEFIYFKF